MAIAQRMKVATGCRNAAGAALPVTRAGGHTAVLASQSRTQPRASGTEAGRRTATRNISAAGIRRSPIIAPDVRVGKGENEGYVDLYSYLLRQRIVYLSGYVNDKIATQVVGSLLALEEIDPKADIKMFINCNGGQPYSVFGVLDTMKAVKPDIQTYALGACYSYASMILAAGARGKRHSMKNTRIMMSQPMGGSQGDMYAIEKTVEELNALYQMVARYYQQYTGMNQDQIEKNTCRDNFMTPEEARLSGLIDHVIGGEGDSYVPASVMRKFQRSGLIDGLSSGLLM
mmetsp:Transcript_7646/g.23018  ORF Transcript_7646/g.23018 Transcript_7646/m.23018 type:complete len:287 (-) Transcript_7646:825-1685(-)